MKRMEKRVKAFGYARLSKDDGSRYSSIIAQKHIIETFAEENNIDLIKVYIDDNVSGYIDREDRPQFNEMLEEIEKGKAEAIIAKDLSRIGRRNGATQVLLYDLKKNNINLLLIQEMGRTFNLLEDDDDFIGLSGWWNERYVKDLSKKVKLGMHVGQKNGTIIQGYKYGYIKDSKVKGKLVVNEELRECIKLIYDLYEAGYGMGRICKKLNTEYSYPTPSKVIAEQIREKGKEYKKPVKLLWEDYMVSRILQDDLYIGTLRTHKVEIKSIKGKSIKVPEGEQCIFYNHHEPIITEEQFERVQEIVKKRHDSTSAYQHGSNEYIFGGFIVCGDCGYGGTGVTIKRKKTESKIYECTMYRKYGKHRCCTHRIREKYLLENFKEFLKELRKEYKEVLENIETEKVKLRFKNNKEKLEQELKKNSQSYKMLQIEKIRQLAVAAEENKKIVEETYRDIEQELLTKIKAIKVHMDKIKNEDIESKTKKIKKSIEYFDEIINTDIPDKAILNEILNKIIIYSDRSVQFKLKINIDRLI